MILFLGNRRYKLTTEAPSLRIALFGLLVYGVCIQMWCILRRASNTQATLVAHKTVTTAKLCFGVQLTVWYLVQRRYAPCARCQHPNESDQSESGRFEHYYCFLLYSCCARARLPTKLKQHEKNSCGFSALRLVRTGNSSSKKTLKCNLIAFVWVGSACARAHIHTQNWDLIRKVIIFFPFPFNFIFNAVSIWPRARTFSAIAVCVPDAACIQCWAA